ncbi:MAG: DUF2442 domain-containing protein [Oscillospiraceae bacterium]|jgi:hypothetical protein|nr:DUF2442 domain-containing protein [Oscillospiraceae bacterium]
MAVFHRIKRIKPLPDYLLLAHFTTGERKCYDVKPLFAQIEPFKVLLTEKGLFERIHVDTGGYGIVWNADIDLSADEIWERGVSV